MTDEEYPPVAQCLPVMTLGMATLADLQRWIADELPGSEYLPLAALAMGEAAFAPWTTKEQLRLTGRMATWAYVLDDYVEREITELDQLDELFERLNTIVRTSRADNATPMLAALSRWQAEFSQLPDYPPLADLWAEMFDATLRGHRYDWVVGWARARGEDPDTSVEEYLEHHDSIALGQVHVPRWIVYGGSELPKHVDVLVPSLNDVSVAVRLANDLATISRERDQAGQNNLLMYDVSVEWVQDELANRMAAVRQRLAPLLADDYLPAVGLIRLAEWCVGFYAMQDLRVTTALSQPPGRTGV